ncbi:MAG: hypothetical protein GY943_28980 [Chloroflexi bacterium]|nr:hypothetical protein [Chloroflexota bacterium]
MKPLTDPGALSDNEIYLKLNKISAADPAKGYVPSYSFEIRRLDETAVGSINLRIGYTNGLVWYGGHIRYVCRWGTTKMPLSVAAKIAYRTPVCTRHKLA